jgi:hypothetical protein
VTYTPVAGYFGPDSFTFKVNDGTVNSPAATVSVTVVHVNHVPVATDQTVTTAEDTAKAITLAATDADGDTLTYSIVAGPTHGALSGVAPNVTYTPAANYNGPDSFTFKANDATVDSNLATVTITVTAVNDAPVASDQGATATEDVAKAITLSATDVEGDPLTYSVVAGPTHGTLSGIAPNLTYTPAANYNGPDSFTFKANDGALDSNIATVTITVTAVNDPPVAAAQSVTTAEDTAKAISLTASDVDGDALTFSVVAGPAHGTLSGIAPDLTYSPAANYNGADSFTFKANDGTVDSNIVTVTISVTAVNDAPVASAQSVTTAEDTAKAIPLTATDVDGDALTFSIVVGPAHGTLSGVAPNVTYTPAANYNGPDSFTFKANDGLLNSNVATVTITVTPVNDPPTANAQSVSSLEDTAKAITLAASDLEGDSLTYSIVTPPAHGTLSGVSPNLTYTPAADYNGSDSFTFKANDGTVDSNTATVSITLTAVNDAPTFTKGADQTVAQDSGAKTVTAWATNASAGPPDEAGQLLTYTATNDNAALFSVQPAIASNGTLTFTPATGATGIAHVTVQLRDNGGVANGGVDTSAAQTFTITVQSSGPPKISIADSSVVEGNSGTTPMVFTVTLSSPSAVTVTVNYQTLAGTASSRDFQATSGTLTFAAGETSKSVTVNIVGDLVKENNETLSLRLSAATNATILKADGLGTIIDDDQ